MTSVFWGRAGLLLLAVGLGGCSDHVGSAGASGAAGKGEGGASPSSGGAGGHLHAGFGGDVGGNDNSGGAAGNGGAAGDSGMAGEGGMAGDGGDDDAICAQQSQEQTPDGHQVTRCRKLFDEKPLVHLPASTSTQLYAALERGGFKGADGVLHPLELTEQQKDAERERHGSTIYEVTLSGDQVVSFVPRLVFDEALFLQPIVSHSGEGAISARLPDDRFDWQHPSLPIRVTLVLNAAQTQILATIQNLDSTVSGQNGECLAPLSAAGGANPIAGAGPAQLVGSRVVSMHSFADDQFVFAADSSNRFGGGTVMGDAWFLTPLNVLQGELAPSARYTGWGHGTPGYTPTIELGLVDEGGNACAP
ncbi:MAG TPA: hypothetical protein VJV79_08845 [Polyangiaceae bacterium]|nr:hypothetical protein [Polyangiaceae bacterium]